MPADVLRALCRLAAACVLAGAVTVPAAAQDSETVFPALGEARRSLVIHAATDLDAMAPLLRAFQRQEPDVTIRYVEAVTNQLFERVRAECAAGRSSADLVMTSSVDHLVVLANEGCARGLRTAVTAGAPPWTRWRDEVVGFTFEPAVIVYNRSAVASAEVPRSRVALVDLLRENPERFDGRIGAYDIALSGIGYLFASYDSRNALIYGRLIEGFGRSGVVTRCCTADLVREVADGRLLIGYNMLGSYAVSAQRKGAPIGIVIPEDYVLVLSRGAIIPVRSAHPDLAARFIDFLLSADGQTIVREEAFYFDFSGRIPAGVEGPKNLLEAGTVRPIVIGPGLLPVQDRAKRDKFLREWHKAVAPVTERGR
jgi:iron(III) transport system substrate-binding protein